MTGTRTTMYKAEILAELRRKLAGFPERKPEEITKREIIRSLCPEIGRLQRKGYSLKFIAEVISNEGVALTTVTLKSYLAKLKSQVRKPRPKPSSDLALNAAGNHEDGSLQQPPAAPGPAVETAMRARPGAKDISAVTAEIDRKENELVAQPATVPVNGSGAPEERRGTGTEIEKRKSAFVPKSDSRDI